MEMDKLGLTLREFLRYGYAGLLVVLLSAVLASAKSKDLVAALGPVLSPLVAVALGALIYAIHRAAVNDLVLDPAVYWLHRLLERLRGPRNRREVGQTCVRHYLEERFSVAHRNSINALRLVRDSDLFATNVRDRLHVQNSENHLVYLTATMLAGSAIVLKTTQLEPLCDAVHLRNVFILLALALFILGFLGSISVCRQFCAQVGCIDPQAVENLLTRAQLRHGASCAG